MISKCLFLTPKLMYETKIDSSVNDNEIFLPGFEVVRKDRSVNGRSGGGVCIYLRSNINYQIRDNLRDDQLECVVVEIIRPHSRPFIVSTCYKPPNSPQDTFRQFESLIDKVDSEQKDFYLLGDLNCNMHDGSNHNSSTLTSILDIYGLSQLISEPTRITPTSSTLIDLCITSSPEKISKAGVVHLGISDHSLVFMTLKISYERTGSHRTIETRAFKDFNHHHFLDDVTQQPWNKIFSETNPEAMWDVWKDLFMEVVDRHIPLQNKRVSNKHSPWITYELTRKIYKRNYMKKIAIQENSAMAWQRYKQARNEVNNAIKSAKKQYFTHNLEVNNLNPRKTWKLVDDLTSRKNGRVRNISEIKVNNESISSAVEMAEVFNDFFATIGSNLASEIQPSTIEPEFYLQPTDTIFSLKPPSTSTVCRLLNQLDTNKATGLDRIPCKLLKLSSSIVGPSLAFIFKCCIDAEIFPNEWKIAKVTPLFKKGSKRELGNYRPILVLPLVSKIFEKIIYRQLYDYLQDNSLLNTYQSGFRSMHSTLTALLETTNNWSINIDKVFS